MSLGDVGVATSDSRFIEGAAKEGGDNSRMDDGDWLKILPEESSISDL